MGKSRTGGASNSGISSPGNGGILGSGIFGMFGTTIRCDASDESIYCNIMKFINLFFMVILIFFVLWIIYKVLYPFIISKRRR